MRESLENYCKLFIENRDIIRSEFRVENSYLFPVCSAIFTQNAVKVDAEHLRQCYDIINEKTGLFSGFRGYSRLFVSSELSLAEDPGKKFDEILQVYNVLKESFAPSQYLPLVAIVICKCAETENCREIAVRTKRIFDMMKKEHPFLTDYSDLVMAAILAISGAYERDLLIGTERCYKILSQKFGKTNATQSLAYAVSLHKTNAQIKCRQIVEIYDDLRSKGYKYPRLFELAILGSLVMQESDNEKIVAELLEVDSFLAQCVGYKGLFACSKATRIMHASIILATELSWNNAFENALNMSATLSMMAVQQAVMCAAIATAIATNN